MWILVLMTIVNAILHQYGVQNEYRISLGIVQIGIIEMVMGLGLLTALVMGGGVRGQFPAVRTHPLIVWIMVLMLVGAFFGFAMGIVNGNLPKWILTTAREYLGLVACVYIGYRLLGTPRNVRTMALVILIAGVLTASALYVSFAQGSEKVALSGGLHGVRGIISFYQTEYAAVTALTLVYVVMTRFPLWRTWICLLVGVYCYVGYATTLSRTSFVILFFGTAAAYLLLPKGERLRKFLRSIVFVPVLFFACWGALWVADQAIGRNFADKVTKHMMSLLPGEEGVGERAWDSRIGGIVAELQLWARNPLMGQGFGTGDTSFVTGETTMAVSFKHNSWTNSLAETGIFGFAGLFLLVTSMMWLGFRLVHDRTDYPYMLMGAVGFFSGLVFFLRCSATFALTSRAAIGFGLVAGMLIRAREIQETEIALAQQAAAWDVYVDQQSGLLVPDYSLELGHFGSTTTVN